MYLYLNEERFGFVIEQYASRETDWILSEPREINRNCKKEEEGLIAINFP